MSLFYNHKDLVTVELGSYSSRVGRRHRRKICRGKLHWQRCANLIAGQPGLFIFEVGMDHTRTRCELDDDLSFTDLHEEFQGGSHQDNSSLEYDASSPSLHLNHRSNSAPESTRQQPFEYWQLESQVYPSSGCSLTDQKTVYPTGISNQTHQNLLPGRLGEQAIRFRHNIKYAPSLELEVQREIAEAGFLIAENKCFISCQYCGFQLTFDILNACCNLWTMHHQHCNRLHLHQVDQQKQGRDIDNQVVTVSSTRMFTEHQPSQSIGSMSRGQQSGSISGQSEGGFSTAPALHDSEVPEILMRLLQIGMGGLAGSQFRNIFQNTSGNQSVLNDGSAGMSAGLGLENSLTVVRATDSNGKIHCIKRAKAPMYANYHERFLTFSSWPSSATQNPCQLAHVGFCYKGTEDFTRCFCCDIELSCWELDDDPLDQHNLWSPDCFYVMSLLRLERNTDNPTANNPEAQSTRRMHQEQQFMNSHGRLSADGYSVLSREMQMKCPTDRDLGILSRSIGTEYTQLGVHLGLQYQRIREIEMENPYIRNRCLAILIEWRGAQRRQSTLGKLEKVFHTLNLNTMIFANLLQ